MPVAVAHLLGVVAPRDLGLLGVPDLVRETVAISAGLFVTRRLSQLTPGPAVLSGLWWWVGRAS
eukprot:4332872-Pyramimonas_sp.AAC.1